MGDLEGHRIRIGTIRGSKILELKKGQILWLTQENIVGEKDTVSFDYKGDLRDIKKGQHVYIDDGNIALVVVGRKKRYLKTRAVVGGKLKERKGVNIPGARLKFGPLSNKDREDIRFSITYI